MPLNMSAGADAKRGAMDGVRDRTPAQHVKPRVLLQKLRTEREGRIGEGRREVGGGGKGGES